MLVGLIADTHGLLRPEVIDAFAGVDHILHAGDVNPGRAGRRRFRDPVSLARAELRVGETNVVLVPL